MLAQHHHVLGKQHASFLNMEAIPSVTCWLKTTNSLSGQITEESGKWTGHVSRHHGVLAHDVDGPCVACRTYDTSLVLTQVLAQTKALKGDGNMLHGSLFSRGASVHNHSV